MNDLKPHFSERKRGVKILCRFLLEADWDGVSKFKPELKYNLLNKSVAFSACMDGVMEWLEFALPCYYGCLITGLGAVLHVGVVMSVCHLL